MRTKIRTKIRTTNELETSFKRSKKIIFSCKRVPPPHVKKEKREKIVRLVQIKTEPQIQKIQQSARLLSEVLKCVKDEIRVGMTTKELDKKIHNHIVKRGGIPAWLNYNQFPASSCISINDEIIHGVPSDKKIIQNGDLVSVDVGVNLEGYISDSAYTFCVGEVSQESKRLTEDTLRSLELTLDLIKPGLRVREIAKCISEYLMPKGYGVVYQFCGHGVGLEIHEPPEISNNINYARGSNTRLKSGMVIAIEPMITLGKETIKMMDDGWTVKTVDGSLAAHFEHTIAITDTGAEALTEFDF